MSADRLQVVLAEALSRQTPGQRAAFLDDACGGDVELRRRVEALLQSHAAAPPGATADSQPSESADAVATRTRGEGPGSRIGPYKLLQRLGEGGMGAVFMAEQEQPVKRRVALKIIKAGMDSAHVLARFEAERQALAMMDHPGIAKVLDAGATDAGRPYFVMELVKGIPITKFCDQEHLTPRERLELFVQVCQAVQHAHQKGIIHRDLKPSNVLIALYDGKPVPKIIDFGVAKATTQKLTERTMFTEVGQIVGTVEYMAPEQAELNNLDIDTRADIYSLGVLLYELLTGAPPFTGRQLRNAAFTDMLKIIRESEPPKPSTKVSSSAELPAIAAKRKLEPAKLTKLLRGDLDWIVMKCLEKERNRRYETANGLAMDVQRYLNDEPVLASPPTMRYRMQKYWRKHRGPLLAAGVIVLVLVGGIIGTSVGLLRAEHLRLIAEAKEREALDEKARAVASQQQAMDALRDTTDDVVEQLIGGKPVLGPAEKAFLEKTLKRWQVFADTVGEGEQARAIRAEGVIRVAKLRRNLGQHEEALAGYREAISLREKLVADFPGTAQHRQDLAMTYSQVSNLFHQLGKRRERDAAASKALALREALAAEFPNEPEYRYDEAASQNNLGQTLLDQGKLAEAETHYLRAVKLYGSLVADHPTVAKYRQRLASAHKNLGNLLVNRRDFGAARAAYDQSLAQFQKLVNEHQASEDRDHLANLHASLGRMFGIQGKLKEMESSSRQGLTIQEKLAAEFPAVPEYQYTLALLYQLLGNCLVRQAKPEAEAVLRQGLAIEEKLIGQFPTVPKYRHLLGILERDLGTARVLLHKDKEEAFAWYDKSVASLEEARRQGANDDAYGKDLMNLRKARANVLSSLKRYAEALKDYDRNVEIATEEERPFERSIRAVARVQVGQVEAGLAEVDELAPSLNATGLYNAACAYSLASVPSKTNSISPEQQANHAERAMAYLQKAVAKGYRDVHSVKNDEDLNPLRQRDDFKKLLSEMQK